MTELRSHFVIKMMLVPYQQEGYINVILPQRDL